MLSLFKGVMAAASVYCKSALASAATMSGRDGCGLRLLQKCAGFGRHICQGVMAAASVCCKSVLASAATMSGRDG